ncbi:MAG: NACHT domain-containing protein [Cyanobacteria bacterium P01_A01_bin.123]
MDHQYPGETGRYDRILVLGIDGEAGLSDVEVLRQSVETHRTDEGWLVTARRISRAARDEIEKAENDGLGCYTFDELLDQDADFSGYLTWLEAEIQQRGIDQNYVPLACIKEEIDPDTHQRMGISRYDERDGWIEGYLDLWLDDPAKEHISVLGEFGTGKTWFAFHYAWKALQRYGEAKQRGLERPRLPLVVPLRDYAKAVSVESLFSEFFFRKHEIPIPGYSAFEQLNRMGKLLLIFDGFDEMAARVDRQQMINNFWELAKVVVPGAKVILTCRTEHFPEAKEGRALLNAELQASTKDLTGETPQFEVLELEKFNDEQIRQVLSHQAKPSTVEQIMGNPQLLDLAHRPVLTELILEALPDIEAGKPVDMSRVYLYAVRHKMERDIKAERTFTSMADKLYFMCELSWEMLSTDRMSINYREFPDRIRKLFGPAVEEQKDLDHWHYDMMGQTMLIRNAEGDYTPAHRSLLEFFVAYKFGSEMGVLAPDFDEISDLSKEKPPVTSLSDFGKIQLTKSVIDLILPMLSNSEEMRNKLLGIILETRNFPSAAKEYIGGNAMTLLLKLNPSALENIDLSKSRIVGADLTTAKLRRTNLSDAWLSHLILPKTIGGIYTADLSPNGNFLALGETNGNIQLCQITDSRKIKQSLILQGHTDSVQTVAFSTSGKILTTGSHDQSIRVWNIETGTCIGLLKGHTDYVQSVAIHRNEKLLASGSTDNLVKLWDIKSEKCLENLSGHNDPVLSVSFDSHSSILASGSADNSVKLWDIKSGQCLKTLHGHSDSVLSVEFLLYGKLLASGSADKTIRIWDVVTGECFRTLQGHTCRVKSVIRGFDDNLLISSGYDQTIRFWDVNTGQCFKFIQEDFELRAISIAKTSNAKLLLTAGGAKVKLLNLDNQKCLDLLEGYTSYVMSVDISSNNKMLVSGSDDSSITIWDIETEKSLKAFQGNHKSINAVRFNPTNKFIASIEYGKDLRIWDLNTGKDLKTWPVNASWNQSILFTPDGENIVCGGEDNTIKILDVSNGECLRVLRGHTRRLQAIAVDLHEKLMVSASADKTIKVWDFQSGKCLNTLKGHNSQLWSISIHPDGNLLVSAAADKTVRIWDIYSGECLKVFYENSKMYSVEFSDDGLNLAGGGEGKVIKIWNVRTLDCIRSLVGHTNLVTCIKFSHDSKILVSGSLDETIRVWDVQSGNCIKTFNNKPYAGMNIMGVKGLAESEKQTLKALGAIEC